MHVSLFGSIATWGPRQFSAEINPPDLSIKFGSLLPALFTEHLAKGVDKMVMIYIVGRHRRSNLAIGPVGP
jgi:hypothetical protein